MLYFRRESLFSYTNPTVVGTHDMKTYPKSTFTVILMIENP